MLNRASRGGIIEATNGALIQWVGSSRGRENPIVLHNGLGANLMADPLPEMIAEKTERPVMLTDLRWALGGLALRGLFQSGSHWLYPWWAPDMPKMAHYSMALEETMQHQGVEKIDMAGFSWGGLLATEYAMRNPHKTSSLIALGAPPGAAIVSPEQDAIEDLSLDTRDKSVLTPERVGGMFGGTLRVDESAQTPAERAAHIDMLESLGIYRKIDKVTFEQQKSASMTAAHNIGMLALSRMPVLAIGGEKDPLVPWENIEWYKEIKPYNTHIHQIKGEGHYFPLLRAEETSEVIARFLDQVHKGDLDLAA